MNNMLYSKKKKDCVRKIPFFVKYLKIGIEWQPAAVTSPHTPMPTHQ